MEKTGVSVVLCVLTLLLLSLAGCGSDSSAPPAAPAPVLLSGVVEDGPIENAKISLRDQENKLFAEIPVLTDMAGAFSLQVPAGTLFTDLSVVAVDGRDRATGVDFTGLEMRSPMALFTDDVSAIVISPLTTLVAELHEQGTDLAVAQDRLRAWLALPAATNLAARPSASLDLQRRALLLSKLALEIKAVATDSKPFPRIATQLLATNTLDEVTAKPEVMSALGLDVAAQGRVANLQRHLAAASTVDDAIFIYKREELLGIFAANVEQMLTDSAAFDPLNANYRENLRILTETTLHAAGSEVITLGGTIPQRIVRYILFTYQLRIWESLTLDPVVFAGKLTLLANDPWIAELARSRSLYSVVSPLPVTELPGNDNQQRLEYFYGSDLSPHYQAEQLIGRVFDDAINDAVLLKIVEGKANAGLIDETREIIATQIIQSEPKANAYRTLANALIKFNRMEEARGALDLARDLYHQVVAAKGVASASSTDVANLLATASSYRKSGDLLNAQNLLDDVANIASALSSNTAIVYGNLITGIKNVADAYIAAGDLEAAAPLVEAMHTYSGQTPAYLNTYKLRIYNWSESAKRYADLGNSAMVVQVFNEIQALRVADGLQNLTEAATWVYAPALVESLYRVGETQKALALANIIPSGSTYLGSAFKLVAIYEALQGNLQGTSQSAFTITDNNTYFPKVEDRLDLLTYFAANKKNPGVALSLINAGPARFSDARLALEKAEGVLDGMTQSTNLARIRNGYVKVAELYALMGDTAKAEYLLGRAQAAIIDDVYAVAVMVDIALGYHNLDPTSTAVRPLLASAQSLADTNPTRYRTDTTPNLSTAEAAALLYDTLINAYEKLGDKDLVHTTTALFQSWAQQIHPEGTVNDALAGKECDYLLRAALYLDRAGYHTDARDALAAARKSTDQIAIVATRLKKYLSVVANYAAVHEYAQALTLATALPLTTERNQAIQTLANAYIDRDDFPESAVASIDTDGDGHPDFFHPLASAAEIAASGLILDDDSDGDGSADTLDLRPLFAD
jgi:hypothetical protein